MTGGTEEAPGATVSGLYDYWLGGLGHLHADRELAAQIEARFPGTAARTRAAHAFHLRAASWAARQGITRFVRAGAVTWLAGRNVHDAARAVNPAAQVVYVNRNPDAAAIAGRLFRREPGITAVRAAALVPSRALGAAPVRRLLAAGEPVCLIIGMVMQYAPPRRCPAVIASWASALPPGSLVVISAAAEGDRDGFGALAAMSPVRMWRYEMADLEAWAAGLDVVPPGAADVRTLPGGWAAGEFPAGNYRRAAGIIARVPAGYRGR